MSPTLDSRNRFVFRAGRGGGVLAYPDMQMTERDDNTR